MTRGHAGECGLCCPCHIDAGGQQWVMGTGMGQLWCSAIASPLWMVLGCHSLSNHCPIAHSIVTFSSTATPSFLLQKSLSTVRGMLGYPGHRGRQEASPRSPQNETTASEKKDSQGRKTDVFLPAVHPNTHWWGCTGCLPTALHTMQVGISSSNKRPSSPACFLAELMACAPLGTEHLQRDALGGSSKGTN